MSDVNAQAESSKRLPKPNNIVTVPTKMGTEFFRWWCVFLHPFIELTDREIDVVASFLNQRYELSKKISDQSIIDTLLMGDEVRKKILEECHITKQHLYVVMSNLRKNGVIINNTINPRLIPNIRHTDTDCFQLLILFKNTENAQ